MGTFIGGFSISLSLLLWSPAEQAAIVAAETPRYAADCAARKRGAVLEPSGPPTPYMVRGVPVLIYVWVCVLPDEPKSAPQAIPQSVPVSRRPA